MYHIQYRGDIFQQLSYTDHSISLSNSQLPYHVEIIGSRPIVTIQQR